MGKKRGNNEGTIFCRKDGRWVVQLTTGRDPKTGKLKRTVVYGKTRKEVAAKLVQDQQELNRGTFVASNKLTLGDWLDTWLVTYKQNQVRSITYMIPPR